MINYFQNKNLSKISVDHITWMIRHLCTLLIYYPTIQKDNPGIPFE